MKILLLLLLLPLCLLVGCVNMAKLINAAAKDPASVHLTVKSIYVTVEYDRTNPHTNSAPHTLKDGVIEVSR